MTDSILQKYTGRKPAEAELLNGVLDSDGLDDLGAFGLLRGIWDRAIMLEFRRKDGNSLALAYAWLESAAFDPSEGITLQLGNRKIRLIGRNLNQAGPHGLGLFTAITRHRVQWIQEADEPTILQATDSATLIERIAWE